MGSLRLRAIISCRLGRKTSLSGARRPAANLPQLSWRCGQPAPSHTRRLNPQRLKPRSIGGTLARLQAVPFHGNSCVRSALHLHVVREKAPLLETARVGPPDWYQIFMTVYCTTNTSVVVRTAVPDVPVT